ncbi:Uncharacterised protein [uncultured archaeon]|nr:Uncharacterised protein [uncultured archaeon]
MEGITDAMKQYGKATEEIFKNKPKRGRPYGIKTPDTPSIIGSLAALFTVLVLASQFV